MPSYDQDVPPWEPFERQVPEGSDMPSWGSRGPSMFGPPGMVGRSPRPLLQLLLLLSCALPSVLVWWMGGTIGAIAAVGGACIVAGAASLILTRRRDTALMAAMLTPVGWFGLAPAAWVLALPAMFAVAGAGRACGALAILLQGGALLSSGPAASLLGLAARGALGVLLADALACSGRRRRGRVSIRALAVAGALLGLAEWWWRLR